MPGENLKLSWGCSTQFSVPKKKSPFISLICDIQRFF